MKIIKKTITMIQMLPNILIGINLFFAILSIFPFLHAFKGKMKLRHKIMPLVLLIIFLQNCYFIYACKNFH